MISFTDTKLILGSPIIDVELDQSQYDVIVKQSQDEANVYLDNLIIDKCRETWYSGMHKNAVI